MAWRQEAEFISRFWSKGKPILIEGELQNRSYTDKEGAERRVTEIIVERACFTGDKRGETAQSVTAGLPKTADELAHPYGIFYGPGQSDVDPKDDYPFK